MLLMTTALPPAVCWLAVVQGIEGHGFYGNCVVPIIENTARECELTDRLRQAIKDYPQANAVLVRRHGGCSSTVQQAAGEPRRSVQTAACCTHCHSREAAGLRNLHTANSKGWQLIHRLALCACRRMHPALAHQPYRHCAAPCLTAGVYVWGKDWIQAKTQAECYDYLFEAAVKMAQLGINASVAPPPPLIKANGAAVPEGKRHAQNGVHAGEEAWQGLGGG